MPALGVASVAEGRQKKRRYVLLDYTMSMSARAEVTCNRSKSATFSQASSVVAGFGRAPDAALFQDPLGAVHIYRRQICQAPTAGAKRMHMHAMRRQFRSRGSEWGPEESDARLSMTTIVSHSLWCHSLTLLHSGRNVIFRRNHCDSATLLSHTPSISF